MTSSARRRLGRGTHVFGAWLPGPLTPDLEELDCLMGARVLKREKAAELADGLAEPSDLRITKRQWGAFHGTELDLQLRRRGVTTVVIGGIATNMGVESTARAAHEHGYAVVLAEDATTGLSADMHAFAFEHIFPMLGRVAKTGEIELQS